MLDNLQIMEFRKECKRNNINPIQTERVLNVARKVLRYKDLGVKERVVREQINELNPKQKSGLIGLNRGKRYIKSNIPFKLGGGRYVGESVNLKNPLKHVRTS